MISMQEYPRKKISRMKSPFQSSEMIDSEYVESRFANERQGNYDEKKFPNVFQFNDRQRVMISDSDLASSINDLSGENIGNFSPYRPKQQKVEEVDSYHSSMYDYQSQKNNRFSFNPSDKFSSPYQHQLEQPSHNFDKGKNIFSQDKYSIKETPKQLMTTTQYDEQTPQVNMFTISEKPSQTQVTHQGHDSQTQSLSKTQTLKKESMKSKQSKKTFKPKFLQQFQEEIINTQPKTQQKMSHVPKNNQNQFKQEIQDENIDIFVTPPIDDQSLLVKEKLKAKILKQEKMNLSAGSEVLSQTQNILNHLRDQLTCPNQQIQLNLESNRTSQGFKKDNYHGKNIVESKLVHQDERIKFSPNYDTKMNTAVKKPRKKIFDAKTLKSTQDRTFLSENRSPYVSQFDKNLPSKQRDPSPSQILMKSLNIIDKMANKKHYQPQKQSKNTAESICITPSLTITRSPNNAGSLYSPSAEQLNLQKQVLELNFEISSFQTTFDLEKFDKKEQINKLRFLNNASKSLFEKYKSLMMNHRLVDAQNSFYCSLKQEILLIRESSTKLLNFQQKYIQTKNILSQFEQEIKNILLLNSRQKYKKIKLLNQAIQVMEKTETYLSLEIGKIAVLLKGFVARQRLLLEEFRDWLKQCVSKQNSL